MVTKRRNLMSAIERNVSGRNLDAAEAERETTEAQKAVSMSQHTTVAEEVTKETQKVTKVVKSATKHYKNTVVSIRFDEGDYEQLTALALEQGSTAASLIRKAVKDIIREGT